MLQKSPTRPPVLAVPLEELFLAAEAPKGVELEVRNSGRGSPLSDAELKASLYRAGVIQPLIWKAVDGKKYVIAGNRRLRFLREIFVDAPTSPVPTQDVAEFEGDWREIAIDTNLSLPPHLVERYEIIVKVAADLKLSEKDTCARFGMSDQQYRRVMALGKMAPTVREAWKEGKISAKTAQLFTLEPDPKEQAKIYESMSKGQYGISDWDVERRIVPQSQQETSKLVKFIGLPALREAKLLKQEDLFATEHSAHHIVTDVKALNKLVGDRLSKVCEDLVASGWKWAVPEGKIEGRAYEYGDLQPKKVQPTKEEKTRLEEIARQLDKEDIDSNLEDSLIALEDAIKQAIALRGFTPEQLAKGGCFVKIDHQGALAIEYGKLKPAEKRSVQAAERAAARKDQPKKPKKPGVVSLTHALAERLSTTLQKGLAEALAKSPDVAVSALIAGFASSGHVIDVDICSRQRTYNGKGANEKHFLAVFEGALKATPESRSVMLAKIAAEALSIVIHSGEAKPPLEDPGLQAVVAALPEFAVRGAVKLNFSPKEYFESIDLQSIVDAVRCSIGEEHAARVAKMKKKDAAKFAAEHVPQANYLPAMLRTSHYNGPTEVMVQAAKKQKKPKPVKKAPAKKKPRK